ncbi:SDR family oxidoreductase [Granulicella sibirica]|uniref:3-oxoacyl-[acyl-carrier protein] reductase n=1 Tax=Granulicella sibirica TaxID=2479048 RepID=A0A4Q0T393_9BACT|nr:SDR family oxidoreductase [Granulicella sibirica]RXH56940.1 3-oxoacyl-[acyl-carrier protein] reductase [Granulicella sibirica]
MSAKKIALITGANKGIGLETAKQLAAEGITVLLGARDLAKGEEAAAKLKEEGFEVRPVKIDIDDKASQDAIAALIEKDYGVLDILINNAGVLIDESRARNQTSTTSEEILRKTFDTNFFATISLTQKLLPLIRKSEAGRIVNLSSILASLTLHATKGSPIYEAKTFAYDASKTALNQFTVHLAHELANTKIKVNSAHPGWVKTDMGTDAAPMEIPEGAKTSVWLATLPEDGPTGGYFHLGESLPW